MLKISFFTISTALDTSTVVDVRTTVVDVRTTVVDVRTTVVASTEDELIESTSQTSSDLALDVTTASPSSVTAVETGKRFNVGVKL